MEIQRVNKEVRLNLYLRLYAEISDRLKINVKYVFEEDRCEFITLNG